MRNIINISHTPPHPRPFGSAQVGGLSPSSFLSFALRSTFLAIFPLRSVGLAPQLRLGSFPRVKRELSGLSALADTHGRDALGVASAAYPR